MRVMDEWRKAARTEEFPRESRSDRLSRLRATARSVLDSRIPQGARCALLDFPEYSNVGDSAIWLGQIGYLKSRDAKIVYASSHRSYDRDVLRRVLGDGHLVLSGGGNFGDLWPLHQEFRERIIADFPDNPILQLPQSVHFADRQNTRAARSVIRRHRDLSILTRDRQSLCFVEEHLHDDVRLCPDMSIFLDIDRHGAPTESMIVLARTDQEKHVRMEPIPPGTIPVLDWLEEPRPRMFRTYTLAHSGLRWSATGAGRRLWNAAGLFASRRIARERLDRGLKTLARGRIVITDRLHAMILCWLSGTPVLFLDNSYRKLSAFADLWLAGADHPVQCESIEQAVDLAERLTAASGESRSAA